jgi:hypothetical protein
MAGSRAGMGPARLSASMSPAGRRFRFGTSAAGPFRADESRNDAVPR